MYIEKIIRSKRSLEYKINKNNDLESIKLLNELLSTYYSNLQICDHENYSCGGYYKFHNNDVYKTDKESAEFRLLICPICNTKIAILKSEKENWDITINNKEITVYNASNKKVNSMKKQYKNIVFLVYILNF